MFVEAGETSRFIPVCCSLDSSKAIELMIGLLPICSLLRPPSNSWLRASPWAFESKINLRISSHASELYRGI